MSLRDLPKPKIKEKKTKGAETGRIAEYFRKVFGTMKEGEKSGKDKKKASEEAILARIADSMKK
jgi:hypothetical protein